MPTKKRSRLNSRVIENLVKETLALGGSRDGEIVRPPMTPSEIDALVKGRAQRAIPRLEGNGTIRVYSSEQWARGREHKQYGLTVKGFLQFLSKHRKNVPDLIVGVENYQDLLSYEMTVDPDPKITHNKNGRKTRKFAPPQSKMAPVLPVKLNKLFRQRGGDKAYAICLTFPCLEVDLPRYDAILEMAQEEHWNREDIRFPLIYEQLQVMQQGFARSFTLRFLHNFFHGHLFKLELDQRLEIIHMKHPDRYWHDNLRIMFKQREEGLKGELEGLALVKNTVLTLFDPTQPDEVEIPRTLEGALRDVGTEKEPVQQDTDVT